MNIRKLLLFVPFVLGAAVLCSNSARAQLIDFQGQVAGQPNWLVSCANCGGDISIDFATTMSGPSNKWSVQENQFTSAVFAANYGPSSHVLALQQLEQASVLGQTTVQFNFPQPLPAGSQMIVWDVDAIGERVQIAKNNGPFSTPQQMESKSGVNSNFGTWDAATQSLATTPGAGDNDKEAYIWDVSGAETVNVTYETNRPAIANVSFNVVPEPTAMVLISGALCGLIAARRMQR